MQVQLLVAEVYRVQAFGNSSGAEGFLFCQRVTTAGGSQLETEFFQCPGLVGWTSSFDHCQEEKDLINKEAGQLIRILG